MLVDDIGLSATNIVIGEERYDLRIILLSKNVCHSSINASTRFIQSLSISKTTVKGMGLQILEGKEDFVELNSIVPSS